MQICKNVFRDFYTGFLKWKTQWNPKRNLTIADYLFPKRCPVCDKPVPIRQHGICTACQKKLRYVEEPVCKKCGKMLRNPDLEYCHDCMERKHSYEKGRALFLYDPVIRKSIYKFKYSGRREYASFYAEQIARRLGADIAKWKADALIPVPLHIIRKRKRGYNQAEEIARHLGKELKIPVRSDIICRKRNTRPMKTLSVIERQNNLKKAFKLCKNDVKLNTIIIIDDIYTTGSTMDAMSEIFKRAGVQNIFFVALSIGE